MKVQHVEYCLRDHKRRHEMPGLECYICGRSHPAQVKKCHPCKNPELYLKYCTAEVRVARYFDILRRAQLWPLALFKIGSVSDIAFRIGHAHLLAWHGCEASLSSPDGSGNISHG